MANPVFTEDGVELQMKFAFHQKRLNEVKNKQIVARFIKQITGSDISVECTYNKDATPGVVAATPGAHIPQPVAQETMQTISSIFGGGEVMDS